MERAGSHEDFVSLKNKVREQLESLKTDDSQRVQAEKFLEKHAPLLATLREFKTSGKGNEASMVTELKTMQEELGKVVAGGSKKAEGEQQQSHSKAKKKKGGEKKTEKKHKESKAKKAKHSSADLERSLARLWPGAARRR